MGGTKQKGWKWSWKPVWGQMSILYFLGHLQMLEDIPRRGRGQGSCCQPMAIQHFTNNVAQPCYTSRRQPLGLSCAWTRHRPPVHCSPIPLRTGANGSWKLVHVKLTQKQCRVVIRSLGGGIRGAWVGVHHVGAAWPSKLRLCPRAPPGVSTCIFPVCLVEVPQGSKERVMSTGDCGRGSGCESGRQNTKLKVISPGGPR